MVLEETFAQVHLPNCQFYLPRAIGQWVMSSLGNAYFCQWSGSSLLQVMAPHLHSATSYLDQCRPIVKWTYKQTSLIFNRNTKKFLTTRCISECWSTSYWIFWSGPSVLTHSGPGIILCMCPSSERCYLITSSLIGWVIHKMISGGPVG